MLAGTMMLEVNKLVGEDGNAPPKSEDNGFTARHNILSATRRFKLKRESSGIKVYPQLSTNAAIHACHEPRLAISKSFLCGIGFISHLIPRLVYCENYNLRGINDVESGLTQQHQ